MIAKNETRKDKFSVFFAATDTTTHFKKKKQPLKFLWKTYFSITYLSPDFGLKIPYNA